MIGILIEKVCEAKLRSQYLVCVSAPPDTFNSYSPLKSGIYGMTILLGKFLGGVIN